MLSANFQGLRTYEKRVDYLTYLKQTNASIVCLQETHLMENYLPSVKQIWLGFYLHVCSNNSCGVSVLLNNNFEYEVLEIKRDREGN